MTLVVARLIEGELRILSDSRITHEFSIRSGPFPGALKAVILNRNVCVCYAGNATRAMGAIRDAAVIAETADCQAIAGVLLRAHQDGNGDADFIVAGLRNSPEIVRISDGRIERDLSAAWIGDQIGFELYQEAYHTVPNRTFPPEMYSPEEAARSDVAGRMSDALRSVARNAACRTVDEPIVAVTSHPAGASGFKYLDSAVGYDMQPVTNTTSPTGFVTPNIAAAGGYTYLVLTPRSSGVGAVGVHFFQGHFGALFHPLQSDQPVIFTGCSVDEFVRQVEDRYGIVLGGFRLR